MPQQLKSDADQLSKLHMQISEAESKIKNITQPLDTYLKSQTCEKAAQHIEKRTAIAGLVVGIIFTTLGFLIGICTIRHMQSMNSESVLSLVSAISWRIPIFIVCFILCHTGIKHISAWIHRREHNINRVRLLRMSGALMEAWVEQKAQVAEISLKTITSFESGLSSKQVDILAPNQVFNIEKPKPI
jgi:hypothetical protein